ncbi:MBL-fold metallo-hydrolase superfamily [hydrothermal vent metagenome]|uniref:MBL-fold metallo-hydrolase superfamily n=1 Tax=hydrothermal vent metagenome TaxID=652676 RepID=A0A3B1AF03_9ZZZZ
MKKHSVFISVFFLIFSLNTQAGSIEKKYLTVDVDLKAVKVSKHVYFVQGKAGIATDNAGFISNAGFVVTNDGVVVFDALGTPSLAVKLYKEIRKVTQQPIRYVIMSHYHADHLYGLQVFKELGAKVIAPQGARVYLASNVSDNLLATRRMDLAPWVNESTHLIPADQYIDTEYKFSLGGIQFKITPLGNAHSEGDLTLLVDPDNVLFSGDLIFEGRIPFVGQANIFNWLKALETMRNVNVTAVLPGHGPLAKDPNALINMTYNYLSLLKNKMQTAVENWTPFAEAYAQIDWGDYMFLPAFDAANRKNAYNVFLFMESALQ